MSTSVEHTYRYQTPSVIQVEQAASCGRIFLSPDREFNFESQITDATLFADILMCLSEVVRSNFVRPNISFLDPVVTCSPTEVRFEGFSGCCGVYASARFFTSSEDRNQSFGTTNVDFNDAFRNGLARLRHQTQVSLNVRQDQVVVETQEQRLVEKKVKLPLRWIRSFCEIQSILSSMTPMVKCSSRTVANFIKEFPRTAAKQKPLWVAPSPKTLRLTTRPKSDAIPLAGTDRLRLVLPLLKQQHGNVSIFRAAHQDACAWLFDFEHANFTLVLSPGIYRGFSGEGQVLEQLADESWQNAIDQVRNALNWDTPLDRQSLCARLGLQAEEIDRSLAALATRGVVGYDLFEQDYFYRQLPFRSDLVESMQPRLLAARRLVEQGKVALRSCFGECYELEVQGQDLTYSVEIAEDASSCNCVWFNKHQNERGPCKHILAATILLEQPQ